MGRVLYLLVLACFATNVANAQQDAVCANVSSIFDKKGLLSLIDLQDHPTSDAGGLCLAQGCCGPASRQKLTLQARNQLEGAIKSELSKLADILTTRAKKFDVFFRKLLQLSREEFHSMFKRTYGMIYEQHSYVFESLFEELEKYYTRGHTDFDHMMEGFFGILYEKMFTVLNSQYHFDDKYLKCVNEHMRDIQPFEDVPHKLSVQLRRAFVATRTFHKALRSGGEVVTNMIQVRVTDECVNAWARLRHCGSCSAQQPPACSRYCHNVIRGCLPTMADLSDQWDAYVDALDKVADRLLGPFNIAMVVEPIDIKISEAIMSFQEHNQDISQKIFTGCGKPLLGDGSGSTGSGPFFTQDRSKRFARSIPDFDWNQKGNDVDDFEVEASLESLMKGDPGMINLRTPEGIKKATKELEDQSKLRERFLQYMRGNLGPVEVEDHERSRRDADPEPAGASAEIDYRPFDFEGKKGKQKKKPIPSKSEDVHGSEWGGPALERIVRESRKRVRAAQRYWSHLPALLCASSSVTAPPCFGGRGADGYSAPTAGEGSAALASNPELRGAVLPSAAAAARAQQDSLRTLTARLKDAYNGIEVQWKDDDLTPSGTMFREATVLSGSGSGAGSGDGDDDLPDDDEDRNVPDDYDNGSGDSRPDDGETETEERPIAVTEPPFVPGIVDSPNTNNVNLRPRTRIQEPPPDVSNTGTGYTGISNTDIDIPIPDSVPDNTVSGTDPRDQPVAGSAERPSLNKALLSYALPVVCAWFGTIVTDLF